MALGATRGELGVLLLISAVIAGGLVARSRDHAGRNPKPAEVALPAPGAGWDAVTEFTAGEPIAVGAIPPPPAEPTALPDADPASPSAIDLNAAGETELQRLPGIGPARAAAILRTRAELGGFKSVGDLESVPGIGPKGIEKLRPYAFAEPPGQAGGPSPPDAAAPMHESQESAVADEPAEEAIENRAEETININTATAERLDAIPGIGPALSARIIAHRARRPFRSPEELIDVQGIGPKNFEKMRPHVRVRD